MRTILPILMMVMITIVGAKAQPPRDPEKMAQRETEWMKKDLSLTDKQIPVVDSLNLVFAKERHKAFESANGDFDQVRSSMEKINQDAEAKFKAVLTEEQFKLYVQKRSERRRGPGGPGGPGPRE